MSKHPPEHFSINVEPQNEQTPNNNDNNEINIKKKELVSTELSYIRPSKITNKQEVSNKLVGSLVESCYPLLVMVLLYTQDRGDVGRGRLSMLLGVLFCSVQYPVLPLVGSSYLGAISVLGHISKTADCTLIDRPMF